jgi:hypothetical protein
MAVNNSLFESESPLPFNHLDDTAFNAVLYEFEHGPLNFDLDRLESLIFNPIEYLPSTLENSFITNLDPDLNFNELMPSNSRYMIESEVNELVTDKPCNSGMSFLHINCRSLIGNFDRFRVLTTNLLDSFSVIGVSETWLNDDTFNMVNLPGYNFISNHRRGKTGGGVGLYLGDYFQYKLIQDCNISNPEVIESLFVEISNPLGKNIIVGTVYRPPNQNLVSFIEDFNKIISIISKDNKQCYIMGDFNLDLLHCDHHAYTQEFIDSLFSHMFIPLINKPTRLTSHSATLIDNIFTNCFTQNIVNGIILNDLSDHLPVFALSSTKFEKPNNETTYYTRDYNDLNIIKFQTKLSQVEWTRVLIGQDPNRLYDVFAEEYYRHFEDCFPLKISKLNSCRKSKSPWITKGLLTSVKKKNKLYKKYLANPTPVRDSQYKRYKNKLNHLIRISKKTYYDKKFELAKSDLKTTWKLINEVTNLKRKKPSLPSSFRSNNMTINEPSKIANDFCKYFSEIGPSLARKIPPTNRSFHEFLGPTISETIFLKPTTVNELREICMSFKNGKAPGYDNLPIHIIKKSFELISEPLMLVINSSLEAGLFPDKLKVAKIIPIYKAGEVDTFTNYRPISILSSFSKIYERVMYNRLVEFTNKLEIYYCHQFGFRTNHSTNLALTHLINKIATAIDQKEITASVFLDLSKAFDTLNHDILFSKLERYGIRGVALNWVKSYFNNRTQFVQYNKFSSARIAIQCGVPQGSILGPLFFILYINDLPNASHLVKPLLFADDTSICYASSDPIVLATVLNEALLNISTWMKANKLSVNIDKTNYIIFQPTQKKSTYEILLLLDDRLITQKKQIKFLGVLLDENLSWKPHINYVCKKVSKSIGVIYRARFNLSKSTKLSLYYTLIYPYLIYCNTIWSSTYVSNLKRLQILQKRIVRLLTSSSFLAHTAPLFKKLKILDINRINSFCTGLFMYSYHNKLLPPPFLNLFSTSNQFHNYNTRNADTYRSHACRTNIKQFTMLSRGPKLWNSLPDTVKNAGTLNCFRNRIRKYLLQC